MWFDKLLRKLSNMILIYNTFSKKQNTIKYIKEFLVQLTLTNQTQIKVYTGSQYDYYNGNFNQMFLHSTLLKYWNEHRSDQNISVWTPILVQISFSCVNA